MSSLVAAAAAGLTGCAADSATKDGGGEMSFFVTSVGLGKGGDLGGLEGADRHCQALAAAAGAGQKTWRAYLSTQSSGLRDANAVNARDRIGTGPWYNAKGVLIAKNVDDLHGAGNNISKETALNEKGGLVNGSGDKPLEHDILTGSAADGTAFAPPPFPDMTCGNWTRSGTEGAAMTGHHDRRGPSTLPWAVSWNSSHPTAGGCSLAALRSTGGAGLLYCFAVK